MAKKASKVRAKPRGSGGRPSGGGATAPSTAMSKKPSTSPSQPPSSKSGKPAGRGAAPWASRHAKKQAEEARSRAAEPLRPGSSRATLREPAGADEIKARISALHESVQRVRALRKRYRDTFFEIGQVLTGIQDRKLYEAKGYSSFEAFAERELDLGKNTATKLTRLVRVFQPEAAADYGVDALMGALEALDEAGTSRVVLAARPLKPPARG